MTGGLSLDVLLVALSDAHDALRASTAALAVAQQQAQRGAAGGQEAAQWVAPDEFKR